MSVLVQVVVGEFQFVECDWLLHPVRPRGGRVRVDVEASGHVGLGLAGHHPLRVVVLVSAVVHGYYVHQQDVLGVAVQSLYARLECGEHTSV